MAAELTRGEVWRRAWPIILANATVPLLSLVDTAVIGNTGSATDLGAVALGGLVDLADRLARARELRVLFQTNADILVRTLLLLFGFAVFTDHSARFGDVVLAANHVLLQLVSFCAFFLDGYANVAESLVGAALGAGRRRAFDVAVRRSSELAAANAAVLALGLFGFGPFMIRALTDLPAVQAAAQAQLPLAALYIALSVAAFQLDGIFIGATRTRDMRNASIASCAVFVLTAQLLVAQLGNFGLWLAFLLFVIARALTLGAYYPGLRRSIPSCSRGSAPGSVERPRSLH